MIVNRTGKPATAPAGNGVVRYTVPVADSLQASGAYANNLRYVPLRHAQTDYAGFQVVAPIAGTFAVTVHYAMSGGSVAGVRFRVDSNVIAQGGNPAQAVTTGTPFTLTTTNDVLDHQLTVTNSANMSFAVTQGAKVTFYLFRLGTDLVNDTHASDFQIEDMEWAIT
jgi:hypothetical protein